MNDAAEKMFDKAKTVLPVPEHVDHEFPDKEAPQYAMDVFMSTDGKHTVHVTTAIGSTPEDKKAAYEAVVSIFEQIKGRYGTKQQQNVQAYDKVEPKLAPEGNCPKCNAPMKISSKGKPYCSKLCWK